MTAVSRDLAELAAAPFIDTGILADPTLYPTDAIRSRLYIPGEVDAATERIRTRTWTRIKTSL